MVQNSARIIEIEFVDVELWHFKVEFWSASLLFILREEVQIRPLHAMFLIDGWGINGVVEKK